HQERYQPHGGRRRADGARAPRRLVPASTRRRIAAAVPRRSALGTGRDTAARARARPADTSGPAAAGASAAAGGAPTNAATANAAPARPAGTAGSAGALHDAVLVCAEIGSRAHIGQTHVRSNIDEGAASRQLQVLERRRAAICLAGPGVAGVHRADEIG